MARIDARIELKNWIEARCEAGGVPCSKRALREDFEEWVRELPASQFDKFRLLSLDKKVFYDTLEAMGFEQRWVNGRRCMGNLALKRVIAEYVPAGNRPPDTPANAQRFDFEGREVWCVPGSVMWDRIHAVKSDGGEYREGEDAAEDGLAETDCPYPDGQRRADWMRGYVEMTRLIAIAGEEE